MKYLTLRLLILVAALSFTAGWAADLLAGRLGGPLLSLPWAAGIALLVESLVLLVVGFQVRKIRDGDREITLDRTWGAVTAALAQANAVAGAMIAGWHGLLVIDQLTLVGVRSDQGPLWQVAGITAIGVLLTVIGWVVENFCRLPPDDPEEDNGSGREADGKSTRSRPRPAQEGGMARAEHSRNIRGRRPNRPSTPKGPADD
ncbi:DUF3180 domain-containing protein [Kocuria sp. JC486]|uniref:DUF3180 family protein n=1 Tax=Kocuria sp. JC486 TaxID=1970736 RepID=UPI001420B6BA|nr:DUF3180 domain-containing protein [Kocuria sp. JC486]